jgi:glutathione S-transferase
VITLHDSAFSPFARKVRIALALKGVEHAIVDGLALEHHDRLAAVNGRIEVPAIEHDGVVVVGSSDIVAYLERVWPQPALYPADHAAWAHARAWERCADSLVDPILTNVSYWRWADRGDAMPAGLLDAARRDLDAVYAAVERDLEGSEMLAGPAVSIAEVALFPHLTATRSMGVGYDAVRFPRLHGWLTRLRAIEAFADDLARVRAFLAALPEHDSYERRKIFWRGDRIEWMLARGHHAWFADEIAADRVIWPGLGIPAPRGAAGRVDKPVDGPAGR